MNKALKSTKLQLTIILLLTFLAYSNIFQNQFVGDDLNLILNWDFIRHLENIPQALTGNVIPEPYSRFRPIGTTMLIIYYNFFGSNPLGYHIHSILAFLICVILIYFITLQMTKNRLITFITTLIFALHPLHSESVTEIIVSLDGTGYIYFFLAFYLYLKSKEITKKKAKKLNKFYFLSIIVAFIAFFSYEITLVLPAVIVLYDYCFNFKSFKKVKLLKIYLPYFALAGFYLIIKSLLIHKAAQAHYLADNFYLTMLTMTHVFTRYLELLIWPMNLAKNHQILPGVYDWTDPFTNMNSITSQTLFDPGVLLGLGLLGGLVVLAVKLRKKIPLITFAIGFFLISLLPVSYIFPQDTLMQERYIYLGIFGPALITGYLASKFQKVRIKNLPLKTRNVILFILFLLLSLGYIYRVFTRNFDFKDQVSIFAKLESQIPNHVITNFTLAEAYAEKRDDQNAIFYYQKTLKLEPNIVNIYTRLGDIYKRHSEFDLASMYYKKALSLTPDDQIARNKLKEIMDKTTK